MTPRKLPPAVEADIPTEDQEAEAEYYDTHDFSALIEERGVVVVRPEPVGVMEIAQRAHVHEVTVRQWRARYADFPKPSWTVSGQPAWDWEAVRGWLKRPRPVGRPRKLEPGTT